MRSNIGSPGHTPAASEPAAAAEGAIATFERARQALLRTKRVKTVAFGVVFLVMLTGSLLVGEVSVARLAEWYWGIGRWLGLLLDTLLIAFMGTLLGSLGACMLCFPASRNLMRQGWVSGMCRRVLEIARTVPELVYALIFVYAFGLGPLPGVLAIAVRSRVSVGRSASSAVRGMPTVSRRLARADGGVYLWLPMMDDRRHDGD